MTKQSLMACLFVCNREISTLIFLISVEVGINVEGGIFWKKQVHNYNKREVEGGKNLGNQ